MKRAHLGTTIRSIGLGGVAALAISPLALVTPAQAGTPVAAAASSASVQSGRPDPAYTPTERRAAIIQAKQERAATANLSFYLRISSSETTTSTAYDTLKVQVISGGTTTTLATYSNLNEGTGYVARSVKLSAFTGRTVTVKFLGVEDSSAATSFLIDDTALTPGVSGCGSAGARACGDAASRAARGRAANADGPRPWRRRDRASARGRARST